MEKKQFNSKQIYWSRNYTHEESNSLVDLKMQNFKQINKVLSGAE